MAKQQGGGAGGAGLGDMDQLMKQLGMDPAELQKMMGEIDPKMLEGLADLGPQFDEMMKIMSEMSPEELQKQMADAMEMLAGSDMLAEMFQNQELILQQLEESGAVDKEELDKFKKDPEYFEQKMKEGLDQMKNLFADPEILKAATETMKATTEMYKNPEKMQEVLGAMMGDVDFDDAQIEEVRQLFLKDPNSNALLEAMIGEGGETAKELEDILNDPKKWRESVKEGLGELKGLGGGGMGAGAGVGEL
jgi:type I site-specific restriction endonuclease